MTTSARPKDDIERRCEDMFVAWLNEQVAIRGVTRNVRRKKDTTKDRELPAFITEMAHLENSLIRIPVYNIIVRLHCQTQMEKTTQYSGDPDGTDCTKMLGVIRDALYRESTISDFNRLADGIGVQEDGWKETQTVDDSEGSLNDYAIELEVNCYIP